MKIQYFYAENMTGLKKGAGIDKIEIDFSQSTNVINLLIGSNGGGKSTLLSLLNPMRELYDGRKPVKNKQKAYKEIHIQKGNDYYIIKHYWNPNKSFIEKNEIELNESGSIKEFLIYVKRELGIDSDFFKIGRLGENMINFTDLKSTDRKLYMSNYFPKVDDYLKLYNYSRQLYVDLSKKITSISNDLDKFPAIDDLKEKVNEYTKRIKKCNKKIITEEKTLSDYKSKLDNYLDKLIYKFDNLEIDKDNNDIKSIQKILNNTIEIINNKESEIDDYQIRINNLKSKLSKSDEKYLANNSLDEFLNSLQEATDNLNKTKSKLEKVNLLLTTSIKELNDNATQEELLSKQIKNSQKNQKEILNTKTNIENLEKEINSNENYLKDTLIPTLTKTYGKDIVKGFDYYFSNNKTIDTFNEMEKDLNNISQSIYNSLIPLLNEVKDYSYKEISELLNSAEIMDNEKQILQKELDELRKKIYSIESNIKKLSILEKRPENCKINTCSFINDAISYRDNEYSQLDKLREEESEKSEQLEKIIQKLNLGLSFEMILKSYNQIITKSLTEMIEKGHYLILDKDNSSWTPLDGYFFNENGDLKSFDEIKELLTSNNLDILEIFSVEYLRRYFYTLSNNLISISTKQHYQDYLSSLEKEKSSNEFLEEELSRVINKQKEIKEKIDKNNQLKEKLTTLISIQENIIDKLNKCKNLVLEKNKLSTDIKNDLELKEALVKYLEDNQSIMEIITNTEESISQDKLIEENLTNEKEKLSKNLYHMEILLEEKEKLDKLFKKVTIVNNINDPKKGIPLELIDKSLIDFKNKTNQLLDIAYNGKFQIDFILTDKDFFITVQNDYENLEDISLASQGEKSITTVSLSLAMLGEYNILYLDEIDGPLSSKNRRIFYFILDKFIEEMGIEQMFVISHNSEFLTAQANLILFDLSEVDNIDIEDEDFLSNKEILFNLKEYKKELKKN